MFKRYSCPTIILHVLYIPDPGLKLLVLSACMLTYNTGEQFCMNFACVCYKFCYLMQYKDIHWKQITTELTGKLCFIRICVEIKLNKLSLCLSQILVYLRWPNTVYKSLCLIILNCLCFGALFSKRLTTEGFILTFWLRCVLLTGRVFVY